MATIEGRIYLALMHGDWMKVAELWRVVTEDRREDLLLRSVWAPILNRLPRIYRDRFVTWCARPSEKQMQRAIGLQIWRDNIESRPDSNEIWDPMEFDSLGKPMVELRVSPRAIERMCDAIDVPTPEKRRTRFRLVR